MAHRHPRNASWFTRFASGTARLTGEPQAFTIVLGLILAWAACGPIFGFSNTWQLIVNTGTTIVTALMVFLIQNTQNRDSEAVHIKIDELIRATGGANNALLNIENLDEKELDVLRKQYLDLAERAKDELQERKKA